MNINTINGSTIVQENLSMETVPSVPEKENAADQVEMAQKIQPNDTESRVNGDREKSDLLSLKEKQEIVEELNDYMDHLQTNLGFSLHEELDRQIIIEVKNRQTDELIKQIPAEELVNIRVKMAELSGLIFDERV